MFLQHHIGHGKDRLAAIDRGDRLGVGLILKTEQRHRGVDRRQQCVVLAIERDQLFQKAEQILAVSIAHQHGGDVTTTPGSGVAHAL